VRDQCLRCSSGHDRGDGRQDLPGRGGVQGRQPGGCLLRLPGYQNLGPEHDRRTDARITALVTRPFLLARPWAAPRWRASSTRYRGLAYRLTAWPRGSHLLADENATFGTPADLFIIPIIMSSACSTPRASPWRRWASTALTGVGRDRSSEDLADFAEHFYLFAHAPAARGWRTSSTRSSASSRS